MWPADQGTFNDYSYEEKNVDGFDGLLAKIHSSDPFHKPENKIADEKRNACCRIGPV